MDIGFIALTLDAAGSVAIGYAALRVHHRVLSERKIDKSVFRTMKIEQTIGWLGVGMVIVGYLLQVFL